MSTNTIYDVEQIQTAEDYPTLYLNAWSVQNIVYELITRYMLECKPEDVGLHLKKKYDADPLKSDILVDISYNWKGQTASKRPAVFITRGDGSFAYPTMKQNIAINPAESEYTNLAIATLPISVICVGSPVAEVEELAQYVKMPLMYHQEQIRQDFAFRRFRLNKLSAPTIYVEAKDNFMVSLDIETAYDDGWMIKGQDLKLKTVSKVIFDSITGNQLLEQ